MGVLKGPEVTKYDGDKKQFVEDIRQALYASKIVSYAQGFMLLREAANVFGWKLNYGGIALMWRGGCIIRSVFLEKSRLPMTKIPNWTISFWTTSSKMLFTKPKLPGERLLPNPFCWECQPPASPQPWPSMMATALQNSQLT